jgi:hypothetical protein
MEFIEAPAFTGHLSNYLIDDDLKRIAGESGSQSLGDLMPGTAGVRKLRWADTRRQGPQRRATHHRLPPQIRSSDVADDFYDKNEASEPTRNR